MDIVSLVCKNIQRLVTACKTPSKIFCDEKNCDNETFINIESITVCDEIVVNKGKSYDDRP